MPIKRRSLLFLGFGLLSMLLLVVLFIYLSEARRSMAPLSHEELERAQGGIQHNEDWTPIERQFSGLDIVLVPAGCFTMGSDDTQLQVALDSCERFFGHGKCQVDFQGFEQPAQEQCFDAPYWIGRTEITNRQYGAPLYTENEGHYRDRSWPVEALAWEEAREYCESQGMRLPSESEWEYAARGPDSLIYPWGNEFHSDRLTWGMLTPDDVGKYIEGASWVGALDMSGGIAEWVQEPFSPFGAFPDPSAPALRVARGGSWFSFAAFYTRSAMRETYSQEFASSVVGVRCAADLNFNRE